MVTNFTCGTAKRSRTLQADLNALVARHNTESRDFTADARQLFDELQQDGMTADEWFASLGSDWNDYEARLRVAVTDLQLQSERKHPSPEFSHTKYCYFA